MKFLVTRPEPGGSETLASLALRGHQGVLEPLLHYVPTGETADLSGVQALAATSAEGIRVFAAASSRRELPVFTVGDATALAARKARFLDIRSAAGDAVALTRLLGNLDPARGAVLHLAGRDVAKPLVVKGLEVRRVVLYAAEAASALSAQSRKALPAGEIDGVLLFSARTAKIFARLVRAHAIPPRDLVAYCLSPAVAQSLHGLCQTRVADRPTQDALLDLIDQPAPRAK